MTNQNEQKKMTANNAATTKAETIKAETNKVAKTSNDSSKVSTSSRQTIDPAKKDAFNGKWPSQIKAAKSNWNKISESELIKSNGTEINLTELVQQRYAVSKDVANKQVKSFIDKCHV
jgi:hypothetical protein